ncbi:cysteine desulfurase family protein [Marinivivus vitaminiproducens]|uniref:cysteine desulfurase family protein n=1 Tax=Marinivivus vitaminiproducens TaxID=3035935 RepID=UPI00279BA434|nr:cysteine desulfurase family protein [Geminicoccaceae bacterium SCSIO 64248]
MSPGTSVYLDANAKAPLRPEARAAILAALDVPGNPSSVHEAGRRARRALEDARRTVASAVRADPGDVVFTSGGTEANLIALQGLGRPLLVSAIEHPSVLENAPGATILPVDGRGIVDLAALDDALRRQPGALVSVMLAGNETGVVQPVSEAAAIAHRHGAWLHTDAAQVPGRLAVDWTALGADLVTLSAHKVGGPAGVGALVLASDLDVRSPVRGGGQEGRRRAGTENLPGIAGMAAALAAIDPGEVGRLAALRDRFEAELMVAVPDAVIVGREAARLANTTSVAIPGLRSDRVVIGMDLAGVAVSAGSACSSGKVGRSHVLAAMALPEAVADGAIRISLSWASTAADTGRCLDALVGLARRRPASSRSKVTEDLALSRTLTT